MMCVCVYICGCRTFVGVGKGAYVDTPFIQRKDGIYERVGGAQVVLIVIRILFKEF